MSELILNRQGRPFSSQDVAAEKARRLIEEIGGGYQVVPYQDGFAVQRDSYDPGTLPNSDVPGMSSVFEDNLTYESESGGYDSVGRQQTRSIPPHTKDSILPRSVVRHPENPTEHSYMDDSKAFEEYRPHIDAFKPILLACFIMIALMLLVDFIPVIKDDFALRVMFRSLAVFGALYTMYVPAVALFFDRYYISEKVIRAKSGVLNIQRNEVFVGDITSVELNQSLLQRFMKVGDIGIATAATSGIEIEIRNIKDPGKLREKIRGYLIERR